MNRDQVSIDNWFSTIGLAITWDEFHRLPRNPAYKYEYFDDQAWLTPRPSSYHALLPLESMQPVNSVDAQWQIAIRPLEDADWDKLVDTFAGAFFRVQPFASLSEVQRREAARQMLDKTRHGGEGPLVKQACFVAVTEENDSVGAIFITLVPHRDLARDWNAHKWPEPPPPDAVARRLGRPHLTWVFVAPLITSYGVGTALLTNAVSQLVSLGFKELASTFLLGNDRSLLWHWRNGFRLLPRPGSLRCIHER